MMKKILHLIKYAGNGGTEIYILNLIRHMDKKGYKFIVVYFEEGFLIEELAKMKVETVRIKMRHIFDLNAAYKVCKLCKNKHVKVIHTHFLRENCIAIFARLFYPELRVVWTCHLMNEKAKIIKIVNKVFTLFNDRIIAVSKQVKKFLIEEEWISESKISLIYNGIDTAFFKPANDRNGFTGDEPLRIACIARFTEEKGHRFLLGALRLLKDRGISFQCVLAGDGAEGDLLKEIVAEKNLKEEVIFLGHQRNIPAIIREAQLVVVPSRSEALSLSALESLACGIPVIGTNVGGIPEVITNLENGLLVEYGDTKSLADAMQLLKANGKLYRRMQKNARSIFQQRFTIDAMANELEKIYR